VKDRLSRTSPLLLTGLGLFLAGVVGLRRFPGPGLGPAQIIQLATIICYAAGAALESRISLRELDRAGTSEHDRHTLELAGAIKISLLLSCLGLGNRLIPASRYQAFGVLGLLLMALGLVVRGASIRDLGPHYGHRIRPLGAFLQERGAYSVVRHGAYAGTFLAHFGLVIVFLNGLSLALLAVWLGVVVLRAKLEDDLLLRDPRYREYAARTRFRILPGIW
jgi:protein-S-isoprenylcysteine O-methyltransferase Ste14